MAGRADRAVRLNAVIRKVIFLSSGVAVDPNNAEVQRLAESLAANPGMPWSKLREMYEQFGLEW